MTSKRKFVREITAIIKAKKQPENKTAEYIVDKVLEWQKIQHTHTSDEIMDITNRAVTLCESRGFQLLPFNITASLIELGFAKKAPYAHFQDPCIFCGLKMEDVEIGECQGRKLTKLAHDAGESVASTGSSNTSAESTSQTGDALTQRV